MDLRRCAMTAIIVIMMLGFVFVGHLTARDPAPPFPAYGSGAIQVRLSSDYFCPPCRSLEPSVEPLLKELLKKKKIVLTFVDVPFHTGSSLYAKYFLYALVKKNNVDYAMRVRNILFEAASSQKDLIATEQVEELFRRQGIAYGAVEPLAVFASFNALIKEDEIQSTPTCVIIRQGRKEKFVGKPDILNALINLK